MTVTTDIVSGRIVEEEIELTLDELCQACGVDETWLMSLVEEGILEPQQSPQQEEVQVRFTGICIRRVRTVHRLQQDLGVNLAGAAHWSYSKRSKRSRPAWPRLKRVTLMRADMVIPVLGQEC